jgi:hypothetical protein
MQKTNHFGWFFRYFMPVLVTKIGLFLCYALRFPLLGSFQQTRDPRTHIGRVKPKSAESYTLAFLHLDRYENDAVFPNKPGWMNEVTSTALMQYTIMIAA